MRNVPDRSCREHQKTHFTFDNFRRRRRRRPENHAVYEIV